MYIVGRVVLCYAQGQPLSYSENFKLVCRVRCAGQKELVRSLESQV